MQNRQFWSMYDKIDTIFKVKDHPGTYKSIRKPPKHYSGRRVVNCALPQVKDNHCESFIGYDDHPRSCNGLKKAS